MKSIYLASGSPRRFELLQQLGMQPEKISATIDETPYTNEDAVRYTERMAREKSQQAIATHLNLNPDWPILSADTSVAIDNLILGKPNNKNNAFNMLKTLSGQTHQVITSVCVYFKGQHFLSTQISDVCFKDITDSEITAYIDTEEPMDKAGSYGIQGYGAIFVSHLIGSYTGVMGLPLYETAQLLQKCGIDCLQNK